MTQDAYNFIGGLLILAFVYLIIYVIRLIKRKNYEKTEYYKQTQNEYSEAHGKNLGKSGEYHVSKVLESQPDQEGKRLYNLILPTSSGTTEIDAIYINKHGLIVIENKNYSGWIFGSADKKQWTQVIYETKSRFYNPIFQNNTHCKALISFLNVSQEQLHSVIVFSDKCVFKAIPGNTKQYSIIHRSDLSEYLVNIKLNTPVCLSAQQITEIYNKLYPLTQSDQETKDKHIQQVREIKQSSAAHQQARQ